MHYRFITLGRATDTLRDVAQARVEVQVFKPGLLLQLGEDFDTLVKLEGLVF